LADGVVITAKILDEAVTAAKLADNSVTAAKILNGAITTLKLDDGSVTTAKLADGSVTEDKLSGALSSSLQRRVDDTCTVGSSIRVINSDGTVECQTAGDGDVTSVSAGTGLTGGGTSGDVALSADATYLQRRVSQTCAVGSAIREIAADGSVTCESIGGTSVAFYEAVGLGIYPAGSLANLWVDVPNASITQTFNAGNIKATYAGRIIQQNGDGTAYMRFKVLPTGGVESFVAEIDVFRSSSPSLSTYSNIPFMTQKVISVPAGEVTITAQVHINKAEWGLSAGSQLIVEQ
jgi:hypothetical protein